MSDTTTKSALLHPCEISRDVPSYISQGNGNLIRTRRSADRGFRGAAAAAKELNCKSGLRKTETSSLFMGSGQRVKDPGRHIKFQRGNLKGERATGSTTGPWRAKR